MALGIFIPGIDTEDEVIAIRNTAKENLLAGVLTTSWTSEGSSENLQQVMPTKAVLEECNLFLQKLDPDKYGRRISRTSPSFNTYF